MQLTIETIENDITVIHLEGRLDMDGVQAVDSKFSFATTTKPARIIVDMSKVSFMSSIGVRTLLNGARGQVNRGGKLVLLNPAPLVREVIETSGIQSIAPIYDSLDQARTAVSNR
jgi:anti-sigma B factor antagonist